METAQFQLILNVIGITSVTSLASLCYLRRRDNRKLAGQVERAAAPQPTVEPADRQAVPMSRVVAPAAPPIVHKDIRHLAADRRTGWVEGLTSAISYDGCC